jgi:hypothetical protein
MTDYTLARADDVLTELVELVETARTLPMSSSCVIPRERTLDLLDALREVLPPEMAEARRLVADRDQLMSTAHVEAAELTETARGTARELVVAATAESESLLTAARTEAYEAHEAALAEQGQLVSSATVHQRATAEAAQLRAAAEEYAARLREQADEYAAEQRGAAVDNARQLRTDARGYVDRTLSELADQLRRMAATADNGRAALGPAADDPAPLD